MQNILVIEIKIHDDIGIDDGEIRSDKETHEVFAGETSILPMRVCGFKLGHAFVVL